MNNQPTEPSSENLKFTVGQLEIQDIPNLKPILQHWIRDRNKGELLTEECKEVIERMKMSIEKQNDYKYFVARNESGEAIGMIGVRPPEKGMHVTFTNSDNALEIVNFFIDNKMRGKGIGTALLNIVKNFAREKGIAEVKLNSGPRYEVSAWYFYDTKLERSGILRNYYNDDPDARKTYEPVPDMYDPSRENGDAMVWELELN